MEVNPLPAQRGREHRKGFSPNGMPKIWGYFYEWNDDEGPFLDAWMWNDQFRAGDDFICVQENVYIKGSRPF